MTILRLLCCLLASSIMMASAQSNKPIRIAALPQKAAPRISAPAAIVVDYQTGRVLYEKNSTTKRHVASTQKLLTALCVLDAGDLQRTFTIQKSDTWVVPTKLGIQPGQKYTRRHLVGALLVKSGNDVARALARDVAGSENAFADVMNRKARSIGMMSSNFLNPHGLTATGQYSTARDMAILGRECYRNPTIRRIVGTKAYYFNFSNGSRRYLTNTNRLLKSISYCNGMKTGTTNASGRCLVSSGEKNGRAVIVVVLGATSSTIWKESESLLRWALDRPAANS
ncbi:D-alanyl-D-alanine carboxypeptidase family protein [Persicirhabdus sediminis]|uniref:D-alanyl-D-alanine carboxypeptidase n=1 Tax=Persicirhabdus sediminis TaxID=454144 RepID=A0A8J7SJX5_9BACT|nr:D-alanyl-D-alanine carboxypeptidase family protein [Persicirhabdus sediminis]MBK1791654.1 D-alanyl-D-alanine carboxypeptidase [Persicirhabdus sediminis]